LNQYAKITPRVIEHLNHVKIIARYGIGVDNVDLENRDQKKHFRHERRV
jgi:D-3-phosphoglycerate dehydrogenase